ncbi:hypothetical protein N7481_001569 [Penicillium waksmanii]|uniref:uncharacterized protein n=1 Tax=Penicillium waksmanii TaxID=69791 RepID=UPI002546E361|nr:uncharacterized protein N7481_001569 [Penicillium waksmanii]KAJ6001160.1 hypothetical protein N7481_001569 [Penicillium waksmanii]
MTCGGLSDKGASEYWRKLAIGHKGLDCSFSHVGNLCWADDQSVMDRIMQTGQQECDQAQSSFHHETVFHHENVQRDLFISAVFGGLGF